MYEVTNKRTGQLEVPDRFGRVRVIPPGQTSVIDLSEQVFKILKAEERRTNKVLLKHVSGPDDWFDKKPSDPPPAQTGQEGDPANPEDEDGTTTDHTSPPASDAPTQQPAGSDADAGGTDDTSDADADAKGYRKSIAAGLLEQQDKGEINYDQLLEATFALVDKSEFRAPRPRKSDLLDALRKVAAEG